MVVRVIVLDVFRVFVSDVSRCKIASEGGNSFFLGPKDSIAEEINKEIKETTICS
jgi:hypothetical protein